MTPDGYTVGVEEEYQLVDPESGALRSAARTVRGVDWSDELRKEMQESTVEVGTPICADSAGAREELRRLRAQAAAAAEAEGFAIVAAGHHPFSRWEGQLRSTGERYQRILESYGRIARDVHNFGMHVHVAVEGEEARIRALRLVRRYLPHLLALSASSPFFEGEDTGYVSYRTILWRRWPNSGIPPRFDSVAEYDRYVGLLLEAGAIGDRKNLYWSLRPHPTYPTLEFRVTDVCPRIDDAAAIAGLCRVLVAAAVEGALEEAGWDGLGESSALAALDTNEWSAARHGLDATLLEPGDGTESLPARRAIERLMDRVGRVAEALGETAALADVAAILERGSGADRMRRILTERGDYRGLVGWLAAETLVGAGVDRREAQREAG